MAAVIPSTDGPPPSPDLDPAAAREAGRPQPMPISGLASPMQAAPQGPDVSGIYTLGQKLEEGLLALSQAAPSIATDLEQCRSLLMNALGKFATQSSGSGTSGTLPVVPPPTGQVVTPAGAQFPGGVGPKPF